MAKDGMQRGPGSNKAGPPMRKGQGPGADMHSGGTGGSSGAPATGTGGPSMGGILKYIANRKTSGEGGPGEQSGAMKGNEGEYDSPIPTGGAPRDEDDEGNNVPGESETESEMNAPCQKCGHKNKSAKKKARESSDFDGKE